ncbi:hypothetical protein SARC_14426, partial [Sphaeroforma arctica JP610]
MAIRTLVVCADALTSHIPFTGYMRMQTLPQRCTNIMQRSLTAPRLHAFAQAHIRIERPRPGPTYAVHRRINSIKSSTNSIKGSTTESLPYNAMRKYTKPQCLQSTLNIALRTFSSSARRFSSANATAPTLGYAAQLVNAAPKKVQPYMKLARMD